MKFPEPVLRVQLRLHIRGADLGIKGDGMSCPLCLHAAVQLVLSEDLILRQKNIALVLHRLDMIAFLFQLVDSLPDGSLPSEHIISHSENRMSVSPAK